MEIILHNLFDVSRNINFYNRSKQTSTGFDTSGIPASEKSKQVSSLIHKGVTKSVESVLKRSNALKGKPLTKEHRAKLSKPQTKEHLANRAKVTRKYLYVTPLGTFDYSRALEPLISKPTLCNWCKNNNKKISIHNYAHSAWLMNNYTWEFLNGKTYEDIGFNFKSK